MSIRILPWSKGPRRGWEIDIRITWPEGGRYRERKKSPLSGKDATERWGRAREAELLRRGKAGMATQRVEAEQLAKTTTPTTKKTPTLAAFAPRFLREYAAANKQHQAGIDAKESVLRLHLLPLLGTKHLDEITTADVQRLKAMYREGAPATPTTPGVKPTESGKTINNRLTVLNKLLKVACEWAEIPSMPCTIRLLKVRETEAEFYEQDVLDRIYETAEKLGSETYVMVTLAGDAGFRRGEILGLNLADVDFKRRQLTVRRHIYKGKAGPTKNGRERTVPLTEALTRALQAHRHLRGERALYFQEQATGNWRPVTPKILRTWMAKVERLVGLPPTGRFHVLRHTFCSRLAMANAPVRTIQELAGHSSLATTLRYMHLSKGAKHQAIELLNQRANVPAPIAGGSIGTPNAG